MTIQTASALPSVAPPLAVLAAGVAVINLVVRSDENAVRRISGAGTEGDAVRAFGDSSVTQRIGSVGVQHIKSARGAPRRTRAGIGVDDIDAARSYGSKSHWNSPPRRGGPKKSLLVASTLIWLMTPEPFLVTTIE